MNLHCLAICLPLLLSSPPLAFQSARFDWLAARGWSYSRLRDAGCLPVAVRWEVEELADVVPGLPLDVRTWPVRAGRYTYVLRQTASQGGRIVLSAEYGIANYDCSVEHCRELPPGLRGVLGDLPQGEEMTSRGQD